MPSNLVAVSDQPIAADRVGGVVDCKWDESWSFM